MYKIIFDMDGVLINSEPVTSGAAQAALLEFGIHKERKDFAPFIGAGEDKFILSAAKEAGREDEYPAMLKRLYSIYEERVEKELKSFPSALPLLTELKKRGITTALASSSARHKLLISLNAVGISTELFSVILSGSDVREKKPSPEIYLTAANKLNAAPADCLVIEDAINGVKAAKAAEMKCFAVTTSFDRERLTAAGADIVEDDIIKLLNHI